MARARSNYSGKPKSCVQYISESRRSETPLENDFLMFQRFNVYQKVEGQKLVKDQAHRCPGFNVYQKVEGQKQIKVVI